MPVSISVPLPILVGLPVPEIVPENVARKLARSAIGDGWGAQRQAFAFIESPLRLEKLLKACGEPRLGNGLERRHLQPAVAVHAHVGSGPLTSAASR